VAVPITVKGGGQRVGLTHQLPGADMSQGRNSLSQQDLLAMVCGLKVDVAVCYQVGLLTDSTCFAGGKDLGLYGGQP
jgi:hypothetical protein